MNEPKAYVCSLSELLNGKPIDCDPTISYNSLDIPKYQRPYKWKTNNVELLYKDIESNCQNKQRPYRLGSIVLHLEEKNEPSRPYKIVDGQQRLVTLALLLNNSGITNGLNGFLSINFQHSISKYNIRSNFKYIKNHDFLIKKDWLTNIEIVVVILYDIDEAFQFFDSQNSRGKNLEAYDYLKAYHLHEMQGEFTEKDKANIKYWEEYDKCKLKEVFDMLFRIKSWSKGESAWKLDKDHRELFYGVSEETLKYPCYTCESILYNLWKRGNSLDAYQINGLYVKGGMFFDAIRYFSTLYSRLNEHKYGSDELRKTAEWQVVYDDYRGKWRTGDHYVRTLFIAMLMQYVNKFGDSDLEKHYPKILYYAYKIRLEFARVWWNRVEERAKAPDGVFQIINKASSPDELNRYNIERIAWANLPEDGAWENIKQHWSTIENNNQ